MKLFYILPLVFLSACTTSNTAKLFKSIQGDAATVSLNISSVYGTVRLIRTNPRTNEVISISPDGTVSIKTP